MKEQQLHEMTEADPSEVGGKCTNQISLIRSGFRVPEGFVAPVSVYRSFLSSNDLHSKIIQMLASAQQESERDLLEVSQRIKSMILKAPLPAEVEEMLAAAVMGSGTDALWAVRSSATAEDLASASFAGQQDTCLKVPTDGIADSVKKCWASFWNERAIAYRQRNRIPHEDGGMTVIVQRMVGAFSSSVMFTCDPISGSADAMVVESTWGLGESVVSGSITPDRFVIEKEPFAVRERRIGNKPTAVYLSMASEALEELDPGLQSTWSKSSRDECHAEILGLDDAPQKTLIAPSGQTSTHFMHFVQSEFHTGVILQYCGSIGSCSTPSVSCMMNTAGSQTRRHLQHSLGSTFPFSPHFS